MHVPSALSLAGLHAFHRPALLSPEQSSFRRMSVLRGERGLPLHAWPSVFWSQVECASC